MAGNFKNSLKNLLPDSFRPYKHAEQWLFRQSAGKIISGFFKDMRYVPDSVGSAFFPKIVGTYEIELDDIIKSLVEKNFKRIINIGAGEGFYAVGFAIRNPDARVIAFEAEESGQKLIGEMAEINQVSDQIEIRGLCKIGDLRTALEKESSNLVVMDIEGGEKFILDPQLVPELTDAHILVELHDCIYRDIGEIITKRFSDTHEIKEIWSRERRINDFPVQIPIIYKSFFKNHFLYFMDEGRPEKMRWYYMKPLQKNKQ